MEQKHRELLHSDNPDLAIDSFRLLGEGWDHLAYVVNGEWLFRFAKSTMDEEDVDREVTLLKRLQTLSSLPVPDPKYSNHRHRYMGYRLLPGTPLLQLRDHFSLAAWPDWAQTMGSFLTRLHATPLGQVKKLVDKDMDPLPLWLSDAQGSFEKVKPVIPGHHMAAITEFLNAPLPLDKYQPVFAHNDLGIEHILVDPKTRAITGVIDWGDAAIADPAYDLGLLFRDLGYKALDAVLEHYRPVADDPGLRERAVFYARCTVFEDIEYGLTMNRQEYSEKGLGSLHYLFED
jgi:aminoglycoside phosphotransferase (APT) family kinase protein